MDGSAVAAFKILLSNFNASTSGAELLNCHDLPSAAVRIGCSERGKSSHGTNSTYVTSTTTTPVPTSQRSRADQLGSRLAQGTMNNKPTSPVVYFTSALSATATVPTAHERLLGICGRSTSGTNPSSSRVTINESLWALPAVSNSINGFHANTMNAVRRARARPASMRASNHHTRARLTTWTTFIKAL